MAHLFGTERESLPSSTSEPPTDASASGTDENPSYKPRVRGRSPRPLTRTVCAALSRTQRHEPIPLSHSRASLVEIGPRAKRLGVRAVWFVSYIAPDMSASAPRPARRTKTFRSEDEAKQFARSKAEAGDKDLMAGTINPMAPRRVISSASIWEWLEFSPPSPPWRSCDQDS